MNDAMWFADLVSVGLIKASFVPEPEVQELRSLMRTRKQLTREQTRQVQRIQKTLEEANIKLDSVITWRPAGGRGQTGPRHHPRAARLLDVHPGPKFSAKERKKMNFSRFYSISQIEYCRNFIFKRNFPIHKLFERSCELGLWRLTAHKISDIFIIRQRLHRKVSGKLATVIGQVEHGHHIFRAYFKHAFLK